MKTIKRIFFLTILAGSILLNSSFFVSVSNIIPNNGPGVYNTSDDYLKHHITLYDEITVKYNSFKGILKGQKVPSTQYKDASFWGIKDDNEITYRVNKKANVADRIMTQGKIWFYAGTELEIEVDKYGDLKSLRAHAVRGTKFSDVFWFSIGPDGDMIKASLDNLSSFLADSPDLVAKMKKIGIEEIDINKWVDNFKNISDWIGEYDKGHQ